MKSLMKLVCLSAIVISFSSLRAQTADSVLTEDNGVLKVEVDLTRGGAIGYISQSGSNQNLVNIHDNGRYVQQSYYAGNSVDRTADGQYPRWSPFPWNPIQAGDVYGNRPQMLSYRKSGDTLYTKCIPLHWDMENLSAKATMEQWTVLDSNVLEVSCKLTIQSIDSLYGVRSRGQELPAVYLVSSLNNLYAYLGSAPFTNDTLSNPPIKILSSGGGWGRYGNVSEHWMAFVNQNKWGVGIFNQNCSDFSAGISGTVGGSDTSNSTVYMAPNDTSSLTTGSVYQYSYDLVVGTLDQIRRFVYKVGHADSINTTTKWDFNKGLNGWNLINGLSDTLSDSSVTFPIVGWPYPVVVSPTNLNVNANEYKYLSFTMKNNTIGNVAAFYWSTNTDAVFRGSRSLTSIPVTPMDSMYTTYVVDLSKDSLWTGVIYQIRLDPVRQGSSGTISLRQIALLQTPLIVAADQQIQAMPRKITLLQNYPNPFNPTTQIEYSVPRRANITLNVYNVLGQKVATLFSGMRTAGSYVATFNASKCASGVYFYVLHEGSNSVTKKLLVLK